MLVERLRQAGALPLGKTNTPEFGMGSHTYNKRPFEEEQIDGAGAAA